MILVMHFRELEKVMAHYSAIVLSVNTDFKHSNLVRSSPVLEVTTGDVACNILADEHSLESVSTILWKNATFTNTLVLLCHAEMTTLPGGCVPVRHVIQNYPFFIWCLVFSSLVLSRFIALTKISILTGFLTNTTDLLMNFLNSWL